MYLEVVETQNAIIRLQSEVINELYIELMKHISCEEAENLPAKRKIDIAAQLRCDIERNI